MKKLKKILESNVIKKKKKKKQILNIPNYILRVKANVKK